MGKLTAELRLETTRLREDAERAGRTIQQAMSKSFGGGGTQGLATNPAQSIQGILGGGVAPQASNLAKEVKWSQFLTGIGAGIFSPGIGARLVSGSGVLNRFFGGGAGGGGGIIGGLFGGGGPGGFGAAYIGLQLFSHVLRSVINVIRDFGKSVQEGARLFQEAASLNRSTFDLARNSLALGGIGLSHGAAMRFTMEGLGGLNPSELRQFINMGASYRSLQQSYTMRQAASVQSGFSLSDQILSESDAKRKAAVGTFLHPPLQYYLIRYGLNELLTTVLGGANAARFGTPGNGSPLAGPGIWNWNKIAAPTSIERMGFSLGVHPLWKSIDLTLKAILNAITGSGLAKPSQARNMP